MGGSPLYTQIEKIYPDEGFILYGIYSRIVNNTLELSPQKMMWDSDYDPYYYYSPGEAEMPFTVTLVDVTGL